MMGPRFDYNARRTQKARLAIFIKNNLLIILYLLAIILLTVGFLLISTDISAGWLSVGLSTLPLMVIEWYNGELKNLPISKRPQAIEDVLSQNILGRMTKKTNPKEIATIIGETSGGRFFAVRFGISPRFLQEIASSDPNDMGDLWREALSLRVSAKTSEISSAMLVVALIRSSPGYLVPLNHLQLDVDDLTEGIRWFNLLTEMMNIGKHAVKTGGLARDWSFGWTPLLDKFGVNISRQISNSGLNNIRYESHESAVDQLVGIFSKKGRQNAVLVGMNGVGKTEIINTFASRMMNGDNDISSDLMYHQVFMLDASVLISGSHDGGVENIVNRLFNEAQLSKNVIICLDNANLFLEDGVGSVDISNILLPIISDGRLQIILAMTEQQILKLNSRNPELASLINKVVINPPSDADVLKIMYNQSVFLESQYNVAYMYQSIVSSFRLSDRYIYDVSMPGRALNLMDAAAQYSNNGLVTADSVKQAIEKTMNIKVRDVDDEEREKLFNLESLIHERVIGQSHAISVISDALRRSRAGVRNQNRPIGTFMFLGPTGVGKTELAKALAAIYFDSEDSIIRIDMNEFSGVNDSERLIEDGSVNPNSLTATVMKKPFSVVLFDEIEKAHPNVILSLLQLLDEGILRDVNNREVSFRDTIIIATSNAGAERLCELIDRGMNAVSFEDQFVDELIESKLFKPEFLNRFDEIITFRPLNKDELIQVADIILAGINKTLSPQKISIVLNTDAKEYLIEKGYDPKLGARPLRRIFQRSVENIIAKKMLQKETVDGDTVKIDIDQIKAIFERQAEIDSK